MINSQVNKSLSAKNTNTPSILIHKLPQKKKENSNRFWIESSPNMYTEKRAAEASPYVQNVKKKP